MRVWISLGGLSGAIILGGPTGGLWRFALEAA